MRMMEAVDHTKTVLYELGGNGHNMTTSAFSLLLNEVIRITKEKNN